MSENIKLPISFWVISGLALLWNLLGVMAFIEQISMTPEGIANMSQNAQEIHLTTPLWANFAFGSAVIGGALGSVGLLIRKSYSFYLFLISLLSVCIQMIHAFFIVDSFEVFGPGGTIMPILVMVIAIALVCYSRKLIFKKWLN